MRMTAFVLLATCPLAYCGAWLEQAYRARQNHSYTELLRWSRKSQRTAHTPGVLTWISLTEQTFLSGSLFFIIAIITLGIARMLPPWISEGYQPSWTLLWISASIGAILSLRIRKAYIVCALTVGLGLTLRFL